MSCCESISIKDAGLTELLGKANMQTFNKDVVNMLYCLKVMGIMTGEKGSKDLKKQIIEFIETETVPTSWEI